MSLAQPVPAPDKLPIKRVVLYKNGVGYFEHLGPVQNRQNVAISFTSGQLNDVLKSLTVLDLNGGKITGVGYGSSAPLDRQRGDLRLPLSDKTSLTEFLEAVRGSRIEIKSGPTTLVGRLLSVERKTRINGGNSLEIDYVSVITDTGEVRTTELSPAFSVKLLERGLNDKVSRYLDLTSSARDADVRQMVITTEGTGDRNVFLSYISEVPVWKATYRIVLGNGRSNPLLQGWAIIDNTVGQDWENVQLSLVAGAPHSFIQNLSQPFYARRPVVGLPDTASPAPQTFEATLIPGSAEVAGTLTDPTGAVIAGATVKAYDPGGNLVGEVRSDSFGRYRLYVPEGTMRLEANSPGFRAAVTNGIVASNRQAANRNFQLQIGQQAESVTVESSVGAIQTASSSLARGGRALGSGAGLGGRASNFGDGLPLNARGYTPVELAAARQQMESSAFSQEAGDLFEYKLKEPITVERNRSALVPIVQGPITAEKVSVWNERSGSSRPTRALWLTNTTGTALDGGSFSVLEAETFAGEGVFDAIRPDEKRLISYATDLAVTGRWTSLADRARVSRVRINKGLMTQTSELRESKSYVFRNEDTSARTIVIEHPVRAGYELRGGLKPDETTSAWMRFRLPIAPKQTATLLVEEAKPQESTFEVSNLSSDQVAIFGKEKSITPKMEAALLDVLARKAVVTGLESQKSQLDDEMEKIYDNQQRLRENMKALKGSAEEKALLQRYTAQLNQQETRLDTIAAELKQLEARTDAAQKDLDLSIQNLSFDDKL